jgi:hypothetical protein
MSKSEKPNAPASKSKHEGDSPLPHRFLALRLPSVLAKAFAENPKNDNCRIKPNSFPKIGSANHDLDYDLIMQS